MLSARLVSASDSARLHPSYDTGYGVKPGTGCTLRPVYTFKRTASTLTASTRHHKNLRTPFKSLTSILFNSRTIDNDERDPDQLQSIVDLFV